MKIHFEFFHVTICLPLFLPHAVPECPMLGSANPVGEGLHSLVAPFSACTIGFVQACFWHSGAFPREVYVHEVHRLSQASQLHVRVFGHILIHQIIAFHMAHTDDTSDVGYWLPQIHTRLAVGTVLARNFELRLIGAVLVPLDDLSVPID